MKLTLCTVAALLLAPLATVRAADTFLVENGQPRAEIIISDKPQRSTRLAAQELQDQIVKISGARLPIVTQPTGKAVKIFVGASAQSPIKADGMQHGAYRIVSGADWMALIGDDSDFTPIEPWAKNNGEVASGKLQSEWHKITGAPWGVPEPGLYKNRMTLPGDIGRPTAQATGGKPEPWQLWGYDERGSFNAVCGFLHQLGVRWYLPGELGEVVPTLKTILRPKMDVTVRPDFAERRFNFRFATGSLDTSRWAMRLGIREPHARQTAHGMHAMTHRDEIFAAHPEWFALYGGKRQTQPGQRLNQLCYSNEELLQETVRNVRAQFDHYQTEVVSVMPPDGYTSICQCKLCAGKDSPKRDSRGLLSDYVWDFVNRVAKEVKKTHPDRFISCCAYGTYTLPPQKIARLEPNVLVIIVGGRRPLNSKPEQQEEIRRLRESWVQKSAIPLMIFENYPFTDRGWYLPSFVVHTIGAGINATKGISQGEDIWLTARQDFDKVDIGFNHFMVYFTARMYWGGKDADVDAMFREYCRLFYGPAEQEMRAFFAYGEANWQEMEKDKVKVDRALELFAIAQSKAAADSVYGKRMALMDEFLKRLRSKSGQLGQPRGAVPQLRLVGGGKGVSKIVIDGKLDDDAWVNCPAASTGKLREIQTGRAPTFGTTVKTAWIGNDLYFAIRCEERRGEKLNIAATNKDDAALWYGDAIEVLLETDARSYYQIAVSPSGAIADLDRSAARNAWFSWDAQAEVATEIADDHWTVEMRIPVTQDENDPLHQVIGRRPTTSLPWHLNVCRQRIRDDGQEASALSPTSAAHFHDVLKFAHFFGGNSHQFEADPSVTDFVTALREATKLRQPAESLPTFLALAEGKLTDVQKSAALEQAAASAAALKDFAQAEALAARIPIPAVKKAAQMQAMLDQSKAALLIEQFGKEDIGAWPFWKRGDGRHRRGRAYFILQASAEAEADLRAALEFTSDPRSRDAILLLTAQNRENNLKDYDKALEAYGSVVAGRTRLGSADEYAALQGIARVLTKRGQFDEALKTLDRADLTNLQGAWKENIIESIAAVNKARKSQ